MSKTAQILNEHHDVLVCSQCQKYLSVFPIKVYENRDVKCGRCCADNDGGVVSLYQELAENCLFKCINRYDGCRKLLHNSIVAEHEATCIGRTLNCPKCDKNMSTYLLVQHFKLNHTKCFLTSNSFYWIISKEITTEKFLLVQDDNVFIILIKYFPNDLYLHISAVTLWEQDVQQRFIISVNESEFTTRKQKCLSLDAFTNNHYFKIDIKNIFNQLTKFEIHLDVSNKSEYTYQIQSSQVNESQTRVELTPESNEHFPQFKLTSSRAALYLIADKKLLELTCSNCNQILKNRIYLCDLKKHLACWDCSAWCSLCEYTNSVSRKDIISVHKYLLYSCKWNCGIKCKIGDLESHELKCEKNKRKCPICCTAISGSNIANHMKIDHQCVLNQNFLLSSFLQKHKNILDVEEYFILNDYMFKIRCKRNSDLKNIDNNRKVRTNFLYTLQIIPCEDLEGLELFVINSGTCQKLENGEVVVNIKNKPELYLKYF